MLYTPPAGFAGSNASHFAGWGGSPRLAHTSRPQGVSHGVGRGEGGGGGGGGRGIGCRGVGNSMQALRLGSRHSVDC